MKVLVFFISFGIMSSCTFQFDPKSPTEKECSLITVPITEFSTACLPYLDVKIEGEVHRLLLDLGSNGYISLQKQLIERISSKEFSCMKTTFGYQGKYYQKKCYEIPHIQIGKMSFDRPILEEGSEEWNKDSQIISSKTTAPSFHSGDIGWKLFSEKKMLLDLRNSKIIFFKNKSSLSEQGYPIELFTKTTLLTNRGFLECDLELNGRPLRCLLDTGCTGNLIHKDFSNEETFEQIIKNPENIHEYASFKINGKEFGSITFHEFPLHLAVKLDAILGMDFFSKHVILIDFPEKQVYFLKSSQ